MPQYTVLLEFFFSYNRRFLQICFCFHNLKSNEIRSIDAEGIPGTKHRSPAFAIYDRWIMDSLFNFSLGDYLRERHVISQSGDFTYLLTSLVTGPEWSGLLNSHIYSKLNTWVPRSVRYRWPRLKLRAKLSPETSILWNFSENGFDASQSCLIGLCATQRRTNKKS